MAIRDAGQCVGMLVPQAGPRSDVPVGFVVDPDGPGPAPEEDFFVVVRFVRTSVLALALLALAGAASLAPVPTLSRPAAAAPACATELGALHAVINAAAFANEKDRQGLLGKVESAEAKLAQGKPLDAAQSLTAVATKTETLVAQGKLPASDAANIQAATTAALACVGQSAA